MEPLLHPRTRAQIETILTGDGASYIFHGARSSGKRLTAGWVARRLNCAADGTDNCGVCRQFEAGNYPDFIVVAPEERKSITIEQIRQLLGALALAPYRAGGQRVVVIDEADSLSPEAQNALLKSLEEPPSATRFILIADSVAELLPTVRSRLATVYFAPVSDEVIAKYVAATSQTDQAASEQWAQLAGGAVGVALRLAGDAGQAQHRSELQDVVERALAGNLFERLVISRQLIEQKIAAAEFLPLLQRHAIAALREGAGSDRPVAAIANCRRLLSANVAPRMAFDRLMLELG